MTSYIDGNNGLTNFANIMGDENTFDILTTNSLVVNNSISLPNSFTGINAVLDNNTYNISNFELTNINGSRSNLQNQIDNLNPNLANNTGFWATFWNNSDLVTTANTETIIPYTNADPSNNGIVYNNNSHIQVLNEGIYLFVITAQIYSTNSNTAAIYFWLKKNGTAVTDTAFKEELKQTTKLICFNFQLALKANDYIEIAWQTTDASIQLEYFTSSNNIPAIPSVIVTASQITYYQNNTAEVNDVKQRITGISYNSNITTTDISGNLSVSGRITRPTYVSPAANTEYTMKGYVDSQDGYYYNLNQNDIANTNQKITGISYTEESDITTIDNNVVVSNNKNLYISNINGVSVPLNSYIDQQVNIAYNKGVEGVNTANQAINSANSANDTATNALNKAIEANNNAEGALALSGGNTTAITALTGLVATQGTAITGLEADVVAIETQIGVIDDQILALEGKTQFQTANVATITTNFTGTLSCPNITTTYINGVLYVPGGFNPTSFITQYT